MSDRNNNGSGAKAFGGIMAVGAMATFGWMLWQSQSSRSDTLERLTNQRLDLIENRIAKFEHHIRDPAHSVATTKFRHMDQLIQLLWARVYQEQLPHPSGKARP